MSRRVLRGDEAKTAGNAVKDHPWLAEYLTTVSEEVNKALDAGKKALIEGTQGFGLSLYHSDHYPKTTSRDTTAAGFLSEVGVSPRLVTEIVVVFRTFPIRVAGDQAGHLKDEITWDQLQRESGSPYSIEEHTTVTQRIRRVGRFDWDLARMAVNVNRPTHLAVNCLDHIDYCNRQAHRQDLLSIRAKDFLSRLESLTKVQPWYLGIGPKLAHILPVTKDVPPLVEDAALGLSCRH